MVELYFDHRFIQKFQGRTDLYTDVLQDFIQHFLKRIRGVKVFSNLDSVTELKTQIEINEFYAWISEINTPIISEFKLDSENSLFLNSGGFCKVFFTDDTNDAAFENKTGFIVFSNNDLTKKWKIFMSNREDDELVIKSNPPVEEAGYFRSWEDLNTFKHPFNSLMIFDPYILSNKTGQKISENLVPCIKQLVGNTFLNKPKILIFTKELPDKIKKEEKDYWLKEDFDNLDKHLLSLKNNIKLSIVKYDERKVIDNDSEHNRFILTNYFFIRTEGGFNIFKGGAKVNNRDSISFNSIFRNKIRIIIKEALSNIRSYSGKLKQTDIGFISGNKKEVFLFYPDKDCRFLNY